MGEGTKGGCPRRGRGPWGVVRGGGGDQGGCPRRVRGPMGVVRGGRGDHGGLSGVSEGTKGGCPFQFFF